tara:strand:+ start:105 stop:944 length:840 start_codon:yes stop_codon:yes gene_type:complete
MKLLNVGILVAYLLNAGFTFLSVVLPGAVSNKVVSQQFQSLATPAAPTFAIWGIIFSLEAAYAVAQLLPSFRDADEVVKAGPFFAAGCVLQGIWSIAFAYEYVNVAAGILALITASLWKTTAVLAKLDRPHTALHYVLLYLPFSIHFGWLTAAGVLGANVAVVSAVPHAHTALLATAVVSLVLVFATVLLKPSGKADSAYALTIAWALAGIAAQLKAPLAGAPTADPIPTWCPALVTDALSIVAYVLAGGAVVAAVANKVVGKRAAAQVTMAQPLIGAK